MSLISLENLTFSYDHGAAKVSILNKVNLTIGPGEFVALKGPSGSGKSTLLYLIAGLLKPDSGKITVAGTEITKLSSTKKAIFRNHMIGFIFQQFHLLPRTSVMSNITLPGSYPVELKRRAKPSFTAASLADRLGLGERLHHVPNQLSGGQQQRVAIARALYNDPPLILADEPTGNLDSRTSDETMRLLRELNREGRTVVIITHDEQIAAQCDRVIQLRDGALISDSKPYSEGKTAKLTAAGPEKRAGLVRTTWRLLPLAANNLFRHRGRSLLTMLGVVIGVAAVLSMITLGDFAKEKILDSYAELGVNTLRFRGYRNWRLKATDKVSVMFRSFDWQKDVLPLAQIFPQIEVMSPQLNQGGVTAAFGGHSIEQEASLLGINEYGLSILGRELLNGRNFSPFHIEQHSPVCLVGIEVVERMFSGIQPLGKIIQLINSDNSFGCKIIGVLKSRSSNKDWINPNLQVILPFTFFQGVADPWSTNINEIILRLKEGSDVPLFADGLKNYFARKYDAAARFYVDSDSVLLAQMKKFLNIFTLLLAAIAAVTLLVGSMGITNMMLVSVSERIKEIGLRKAIGATDRSIRLQLLLESLMICFFSGLVGLIAGFLCYEGLIYCASQFVRKLEFDWVFNTSAIAIAFLAIIVVGILSGLLPALKAERLQVIEALRSE